METKKLNNNPNHELTDEEIWISTSVADDTHIFDVDKAFERFKKRTKISEHHNKRFRLHEYYSVAAVAVILLALITVTAYFLGNTSTPNNFSNIVVEVPLGSKTKIQLPDGTNVWLNSGSQITYSQGFGITDRKISFTGEGYFEVTKNKEKPFVVQTSELNVKVLGTKFNLRNYKDDEEAIVNLLEGKIALVNKISNADPQNLSPNEKMTLNKETGVMNIIKTENVEHSSKWTNGTLVFDEDLLPDIIKILERNYDVKINILNKDLYKTRFYGSFDQHDYTIYDILNRFSATGRLTYFEKDNIIYVK